MENILYFHKKYPHLKIIPLKQNYRSTQTIIDAAETLINQNQNKITKIIPGIEKKFVAKTGNVENKIKVAALSTEESEYFYIVEKIKELSAQGMAYKDMAVIYRNNKDALPLTELLKKINIPFSLSMDENVLDNFYVKKFINALKLINKPKDNVAFIDYLFSEFFSVRKEDLIALSQHVYSNKGSIYEILKTKEMPEGLSLSNKEIFFQIIDVINDLIIAQQNLPFQEYVVKALHAFKISEKILCSKENLIALTMMNSFVSWVREQSEKNPQYNLSKMIEDISFMKDINIKIPGQELYGSSEGANLLTAHKAKGLEFPVVFIIKSIDVNWEEKRSAEKLKLPQDLFYLSDVREPDEKEEIRRLYYVALTRAKEQVFISYHIRKNDGKELLPSMFIKELKDDTKEFENVEGYEKKVIERITLNLSQDKGAQAEEVSLNYLKKLAGQYVLNPTALNNYLKCPAFFKFNNLYRIPSESNKHAALGSSIHKTLEYVFRIAEKGAMPDIKKWEEFFEKNILTYPLVELDLKQCLTQGKEYLRGYYNNYKASFHTRCLLEYDFSHRHVHFEEIPITGKLDKVEIHSDNTVTIVDYKTGKAKSRRDILGLNASSDGGYFRQLVFYKLLVDSDARFPYKIKDTMLDFIKPKDNGEYSREYFEIDDESLSALKALIKEVHSKILNLDFPKTENKKECEECVYRGYC